LAQDKSRWNDAKDAQISRGHKAPLCGLRPGSHFLTACPARGFDVFLDSANSGLTVCVPDFPLPWMTVYCRNTAARYWDCTNPPTVSVGYSAASLALWAST